VASPFRQLNPKKLADAKAEFAALEQDGVLRRSNSLWASPLHMVHKADGSWRPCSNYRRLNGVTVPNTYPLPNMMDFTTRMSGCKFFSKVDLRKGYHQIPMHEPDIPKTAIITPFGLFEYTRMTFGMRNAGNTFQWLMDRVMAGADAAFAYLDDVLIGSATLEQHLLVVADVFRRLAAAGLVVNAKKCLFKVPSIKFLGHRVTAGGIAPLPHCIATLQQHPRPGTVKELQGFLGTVNFYRRFVAGAARILKPLTDALRGGPPPSSSVSWDNAMERAFLAAKAALAAATQLAHPCPSSQLSLAVDASVDHVGAIFQQRALLSSSWRPLGFFSQKLDPAQVKYSAFDRELFACVAAIRHFRYMLEGRTFAFSPTTTPSSTPSPRFRIPGQPARAAIYPTWPSSRLIFAMSQGSRTSSPTPSPDCRRPASALFLLAPHSWTFPPSPLPSARAPLLKPPKAPLSSCNWSDLTMSGSFVMSPSPRHAL
jgi:hypothetical protein